jgi:hypothetical protein
VHMRQCILIIRGKFDRTGQGHSDLTGAESAILSDLTLRTLKENRRLSLLSLQTKDSLIGGVNLLPRGDYTSHLLPTGVSRLNNSASTTRSFP